MNVSQDTLRYYEKIGLLAPIRRADSGHRRYDEVDLAWVRFLTILRATGMPIRRMLTYVGLERQGDATIDAKIAFSPRLPSIGMSPTAASIRWTNRPAKGVMTPP